MKRATAAHAALFAAAIGVGAAVSTRGGAAERKDGPGYQPVVLVERPAQDLDRAIAFYEGKLGLKLHMRLDQPAWAEFETPVHGLMIGVGPGATPNGSFNLAVDDVDAARAALEARGVVFDGPTIDIPGVVRLAGFKDPDGNSLRLAGAPKKAGAAAPAAAEKKEAPAEPAQGAPGAMEQLAFIAGPWRGEYEGGAYEEHWTAPAAGSMVGMFTWTHKGKVRVHELNLLEQEGDSLTLRLRHFGAGMKAWEEEPLVFRLKSLEPGKAVFEERAGDVVKTLTYHKRPDGALAITLVEPDRSGAMKPFEFVFKPIAAR